MKIIAVILLVTSSIPVLAAGKLSKTEDVISVAMPGLYPETAILNEKSGKFLVGSIRRGGVFEVDGSGKVRPFIQDARLKSVLGIVIDYKTDRIFVTNSDTGSSIKSTAQTTGKLAALVIYRLSSRKLLHYVDLGKLLPDEKHLANGVAIDSAGNAYVTDSFSPTIFKVDTLGNGSIFLGHPDFSGPGISLNGIVFHPDGYLIAVKKSDGQLFKIPVESPENFSKIAIKEKFLGGDGLLLVGKNNLVIISNQVPGSSANSSFLVTSNDGWQSAEQRLSSLIGAVYPTTAVLKDEDIFVLHSGLDALMKAPPEKKNAFQAKAIIQKIGMVISGNPKIVQVSLEGIKRTVLETYEIPGADLEYKMVLTEYPPGASLPIHHHPVAAMNYILEGSAESQYEGQPLVKLKAGDSFQDKPNERHLVFGNTDRKNPLKYIITYTVKKGSPFLLVP